MAAYWHVILPTELTMREKSKASQKRFLQKFGHVYHRLQEEGGGGDHVIFVPKIDVQQRFFEFYRAFLQLALERAKGNMILNCASDHTSTIETLIAQMQEANPFGTSDMALVSIHKNYYLNKTSLIEFIVYEGWPFGKGVSLSGLSLLTSGWKYGEGRAALLVMQEIVEALRHSYPEITELLFICAY
jgi:hypothetical protein